jgi:hypothetical protein
MAIEGDISAKKYEADQKKLTAGIGLVGTVGSGLAEYSTAKKGGYEGGIMGYLGEKAKEHYGLDEKTTTITTGAGGKPETSVTRTGAGVGDVKTDYRMAWKEGTSIRKEAAQDWWKNVKGLIPSTKIGKHWESEGKDFLKQSLGIGKSNIPEAKLQTGEPFKTQEQPSSGSSAYSGEFGEHYEPVSYVAKDEPKTVGAYNLRTQYNPEFQSGEGGLLGMLSLKARDIFGEQSDLPYIRAQAAKVEEEKRIKEEERIASLRKYYSQHYSNPFGKKGQ